MRQAVAGDAATGERDGESRRTPRTARITQEIFSTEAVRLPAP